MICYLCNSSNSVELNITIRHNDGKTIHKCIDCGLIYLKYDKIDFYSERCMLSDYGKYALIDHSKLNYSELTELFDNYSILCNREKSDIERRIETLKTELEDKVVLDFGCGSGEFSKQINNFTKATYCIEPSKFWNYKYIQSKLTVLSSIKEIKTKLDVITMFHVLEHIPDPITLLKELKSMLTENGTIIIEVPNSDDILFEQSNDFKNFTIRADHLFYYNKSTLISLIEKSGFKVKLFSYIQRFNASNHLKWYKEGKPNGHLEINEWSGYELNKAYVDELKRIGKTDTMLIIAQ